MKATLSKLLLNRSYHQIQLSATTVSLCNDTARHVRHSHTQTHTHTHTPTHTPTHTYMCHKPLIMSAFWIIFVYRQRCHKKCPGHTRHRHLSAGFSNHGLVSGCQRICAGQYNACQAHRHHHQLLAETV